MNNYIGIDLGTTNSAICAYDGEAVRLFKSPDQNDVTPSAIFFDRRGNKYVGQRAYNQAARNPDSAAVLFKRLMGTSTPIRLPAVDMTLTPEACSAELLQVLYGYLPEEVRNAADTGTVITVPAAFNQMQKDATMAAAELAGVGRVALMQEPVAAVMSVMRQRRTDGVFLVYDLGGGTLDVALAQSLNGRVSVLAHGGIEMCGGRDFDRTLVDNVVTPWLLENFDLPENLFADKRYDVLRRMATWAAERAKIELSAREEAVISADDGELRIQDRSGKDVYLDVTLTRSTFDKLVEERLQESIVAARETMDKARLGPHDIDRIVFVGGPTQYKPLRDKVAFELGIAASTDVNPMTAVAEGAALFAESIDWSTQSRSRKSGRGSLAADGDFKVSFNYVARTPDSRAKLVAKLSGSVAAGTAFQIDSLDTGWSSGRAQLKDGTALDLPLTKPGENTFKVFVLDPAGGAIRLPQDKIVITRTAAQIDAIPASHSIGVAAVDKIGGAEMLTFLVEEGDPLPKKGRQIFRAMESLKAGAPGAIRFQLWEGPIRDVPADNRFIGVFEIKGSDFSEGVIAKGDELACEYEVLDSGNIMLEVTVPSIGNSFKSSRNFYSRQEGQIDYTQAARRIDDEATRIGNRLEEIAPKLEDPRLADVRARLARASHSGKTQGDPEASKQALDDLQQAKQLLAQIRKDHRKEIRQLDLENLLSLFNNHVRKHATAAEEGSLDNLVKTARRAIDNNSMDFEGHLDDLRSKNFSILWRQDWFVIDRFNWLAQDSFLFPNAAEHQAYCQAGRDALQAGDIQKLRQVVAYLDSTRINSSGEDDFLAKSNILKG